MEQFKQFAINLAKEAGGIMRANFMLGMKREWKEDNSPVTETDLAINQLVIDSVRNAFPNHSVLAEEGSSIIEGSTYTWVCDPVDGTMPFSHGIPTFVFSLALVENGVPIVGVVYDPLLDRLYSAVKGQGAQLNERPIKVSQAMDFQKEIVVLEWPSFMPDTQFVCKMWQEIVLRKGKIIRLGSAVYSGALVACGEFLGVLFGAPTAHDAAALKILVEEAGGKVTDIDGNEQRYDRPINGAIISNGHVHDQLLELVRKSRLPTQT